MYFETTSDGAIALNFGSASASNSTKFVIGKDDSGYIVLSYGSDGSTIEFPNYGHDLAGARIITCTNSDGEAIILTEQMMNPFVLCKADGIYDVDNNVSITNNAMIDGGTYFGTTMSTRNIILTIKDIEGHDSNRELVDLIFTKNKPGILQVQDGTHLRAIEYYVESITTTATPKTRLTTISLLCPDPFFYDPTDTSVYIATLISDFEFEHEFDEYGEELGHFNESKIGTIENESADDNIGMTIIIEALGEVINPKLTMIETQEYIAVGTDARPYTMNYKDTITISTVSGKKNVYDADGNSINAYLDEDSTFFQLHRGENSIGYTASTGDDYMAITVMYRYKYLRA